MGQHAGVNEIRYGPFIAPSVVVFVGIHPREIVRRPMRVGISTAFFANVGPRDASVGGASVIVASPIRILAYIFASSTEYISCTRSSLAAGFPRIFRGYRYKTVQSVLQVPTTKIRVFRPYFMGFRIVSLQIKIGD